MRELTDILAAHKAAEAAGGRCAMATVARVTGSSYRRPGARLLILPDGKTVGGISGGCLEADVALRARGLVKGAPAQLFSYDNRQDQEQIFGVGGGCNGIVDILIEPLSSESPVNPIALLSGVLRLRRPAVLVTVIQAVGATVGERVAKTAGGEMVSSVQSPALAQWMREQIDRGVCGVQDFLSGDTRVSIVIETIEPPPDLVIFGAGSDAMPLAAMGSLLGWFVTVADHRSALATPARFPSADQILSDPPEQLVDQIELNADSAVVVMTHDLERDRRLLQRLSRLTLGYLAVLGPAHRTRRLLEGLPRVGQKVFFPAGLDLGAETPQEIALSIIAEIQSVRVGRVPRHLCERAGPIHLVDEPAPTPPTAQVR